MKKFIIALLVALMVMVAPVCAMAAIDFEAEVEYDLNTEDSTTTLTIGTGVGPFEVELEYANAFEPEIDELTFDVVLGFDPFEFEYERELLGDDLGTFTLTFSVSI